MKDARKNVDDIHALWYDEACTLAEGNDIEPHMPRRARHQIHRSNPPSTSVSDYFKFSLAIPMLDHLISEMDDRFSNHSHQALQVLKPLPSAIISLETSITGIFQSSLPYILVSYHHHAH